MTRTRRALVIDRFTPLEQLETIDCVINRIAIRATDFADIDELFPEDLRINFYRIVQESLSNIMKHAQATEVSVRIVRTAASVVLTIQDNGRGFSPAGYAAQAGAGGLGLTGMAERATLLGGRLKMRSEPTNGAAMTVEIPLRGEGHVG